MLLQIRVLALAISFFLFTFKGFCSDKYNNSEINLSIAFELNQCGNTSIVKISDEGEIYLNPSNIIPTEHGLFLKTDTCTYLSIPVLLANQSGCYTIETFSDSTVYPIIRCRNCDRLFSPTIFNKGVCPHCGTQN